MALNCRVEVLLAKTVLMSEAQSAPTPNATIAAMRGKPSTMLLDRALPQAVRSAIEGVWLSTMVSWSQSDRREQGRREQGCRQQGCREQDRREQNHREQRAGS